MNQATVLQTVAEHEKSIGFLGRKKELNYLLSRVMHPISRHISVHGLPHIGKTSLLLKLADLLTKEPGDPYCVVYHSIGMRGFAEDMMYLVRRAFPKALSNNTDPGLQSCLQAMRQVSVKTEGEELVSLFKWMLQRTTALGIKVVLLLDEFEHIAGDPLSSPEERASGLSGWTEKEYLSFAKLLLDDSLNFICMAASRPRMEENLKQFELKVNPFISYMLPGFNEEDMAEYFDVLQANGYVCPSREEQQELLRCCGHNPLLLQRLGMQLINAKDGVTVYDAYLSLKMTFKTHFEGTTDFMKEEEKKKKRNFSHIVKCYFGASSDYRDILEQCIDLGYIELLEESSPYTYVGGNFYYVDEMGKYGAKGKRYVYVTLSHLFVDYLYSYELDNITDTRDLLTGFVHTLRDITKKELSKRFENWNEEVLLRMTGQNPQGEIYQFVMPCSDGRYVSWRLEGGEWNWSVKGETPSPQQLAEREAYFNALCTKPLIANIAPPSFRFLTDAFNAVNNQGDMPVLDVINLTENGQIILHFTSFFENYFGCFGESFNDAEDNPFLACLKKLHKTRNKIAHFSRSDLSEEEAFECRELCKELLSSIYTYISTRQPADPTGLQYRLL